jgi:hypothetical protein
VKILKQAAAVSKEKKKPSDAVAIISYGHLEKWRLPSNHANLICDFTICGLGDDGTAGLF